MLRTSLRVLAVATATLLVTALGAPALADPDFAQPTLIRQDKGPYKVGSTSFAPGTSNCSNCPSLYDVVKDTTSVRIKTWHVRDESKKYDYYFVGVDLDKTGYSSRRTWSWTKVKITSRQDVNYASYSSGLTSNTDGCHTADITLGASYYGLGIGTKLATLSTCATNKIERTHVTRGDSYYVNHFHGVRHLQLHRFVRVANGSHPSFRVDLTLPTDACTVQQWADGGHYYCTNSQKTRTYFIGTTS